MEFVQHRVDEIINDAVVAIVWSVVAYPRREVGYDPRTGASTALQIDPKSGWIKD